MTGQQAKLVEGDVHDDVLVLRILIDHIREADVSYGLRDQMMALVQESRVSDVVLDFEKVEFLGSIGLLALVSLRRHLTDGRIFLAGLSEPLHGMLVACRLVSSGDTEAPFETTETVSQALAACRP